MAMEAALDILPDSTAMGAVTLNVDNIDTVGAFYQEGAGLQVLSEDSDQRVLGNNGKPVMILRHEPRLSRESLGSAGLYHTAILYPQVADLAAALYRIASKYPLNFTGSADHLVSKAFYFNDPEGNGVELYWDRPRSEWKYQGGQIEMGVLRLDPNDFLRDNLAAETAQRLESSSFEASDAQVGHVHLQVGNIQQARDFYVDTVGFEMTLAYGSQALFVSAGGYHHHLGMNTWNSAGAGLRAPALGLGSFHIEMPDREALDTLTANLAHRGIAVENDGREVAFSDPWANRIVAFSSHDTVENR